MAQAGFDSDFYLDYGCYDATIKQYIEGLTTGYSIPNANGVYCCPTECSPYMLCTVYRFINYVYLMQVTNENICCVNVEAFSRTTDTMIEYLTEINITLPTECTPNNFYELCARIESIVGPSLYEDLMYYGIVEYSSLHSGYSQLAVVLDHLDTLNLTALQYYSILYQILREGIVMWCEDGAVKFQSVLSYIESHSSINNA